MIEVSKMPPIRSQSSPLSKIDPDRKNKMSASNKLMTTGRIRHTIALVYFANRIMGRLTAFVIVKRSVPASRSPAIASWANSSANRLRIT